MEELKIRLLINGVGIARDVHPVFGDDIKISLNREENQIFRREKIDGTFQFFGDDFNLIYGCSIYTTFTLQIYRGNALVGTADFIRTDCDFNLDDEICKVKLTTKDIYDKFLNAYDNKYNLVKLAPQRQAVTLTKRAILQFYVRGENVVTNVVGGVSYEQSCKEVYDANELYNTYHFSGYLPLSYIAITTVISASAPTDVYGRYILDGSTGGGAAFIYKNENNDRFRIQVTPVSGKYMMLLIDDSTGHTVASCDIQSLTSGTTPITFLSSGSTQTNYATGTFYSDGDLFCRLLLPKAFDNSYARSIDSDITDYDSNYPYVSGVSLDIFAPKMKIVSDKSVSPTEWGIDSKGYYFQYPSFNLTERQEGKSPVPIGQSHWERMSSWLLIDDGISDLVDDFDLPYILKDAYPLWSAIKVLLKEVDPTLSFDNTYDYSQFLFGTTGNSQHLMSYNFPAYRSDIYITPITNVKKTFYEQAAQRGEISLKQILDMLRTFYQCYWWIDANGRLKIEHIIYFKNGNTYEKETPIATIDVTNKDNLPTKESWGFAQNTIGFETSKCPARYEFAWGDESTYPFVGEPIDVKDKYLDSSRKESVSVNNFISDIDYIVTNGGDISNDIFAVFEAGKNTHKVAISNIRLDGESPKYRLQNPFMAFLFAEQYYYPYDLSGWRANAGSATIEVFRTKEIAKQALSCPLTLEEMRTIGVIRTEVGDGIIDKMNAEINTLYAKNTILYEQKENVTDKIYFLDFASSRGYVQYFNPTQRKVRLRVGIMQDGAIQTIQNIDVNANGNKMEGIGTTQSPIILDAEDISAFTINRRFRKADGVMTFDDRGSSNGVYVLEINGNKGVDRDYAGIHISVNSNIKVTITSSTAENFNKAYLSRTNPCCTTTDGALTTISGQTTYILRFASGDSLYIGYIKDITGEGGEDKVTITIEEV